MVSVNNVSDPRELRNYLRDLIALSALPATWKAYEPQRIAESVAAALIGLPSLAPILCMSRCLAPGAIHRGRSRALIPG